MMRIQVELPANRDFVGALRLENERGRVVAGPFDVCARSDDRAARAHQNPTRDRVLPFGDTPLGVFRARPFPGARVKKALPGALGRRGVIALEALDGEAALADANGRFALLIHAGAPDAAGRLRPSAGSLRLSDGDLAALLDALEEERELLCTCVDAGRSRRARRVSALPAGEPPAEEFPAGLLPQLRMSSAATPAAPQPPWTMAGARFFAAAGPVGAGAGGGAGGSGGSASGGGGYDDDPSTPSDPAGDPNATDAQPKADAMVQALWERVRPKSQKLCATYVTNALQAAGLDVKKTPDAYQLGPSLEKAGFEKLPDASYGPSAFRKGDVVVFQPIKDHPHGHVAVYDGAGWLSDFIQLNFAVVPGYRTGLYSVYRPKP